MACILLLFHGTILIMYHLTDDFVVYIFWIKGDSLFCLSNIVLWLLSLVLARQDDMKTSEVSIFKYVKKIPKGLKW